MAKVKGCRLSEFLSRRDKMIDQLSHLAGGRFTSSITSVQMNMFECGGVVIGVRVAHRLFDAFSAANFLTSWASTAIISRQAGIDDDHEALVWPTFGLTSLLQANDLPEMKPTPVIENDNGVTKRIVFDGGQNICPQGNFS